MSHNNRPDQILPFTLTVSNQTAGVIESELYFEGSVTMSYDEGNWVRSDFSANLCGFGQFQNGAKVAEVENIKKPWFEVFKKTNLQFETDCLNAALHRKNMAEIPKR